MKAILNVLSILGLLASCGTNSNNSKSLADSYPKRIAGYRFTGVVNLEAYVGVCGRGANKEVDACNAVGGEVLDGKDCEVVCTKPIAPEGSVSGFNFKGYQVKKVSPNGASTVISAESEACAAVNGVVSRDVNEKPLCSKLIAPKGQMAGFDFKGFTLRTAPAKPSIIAGLRKEAAACERVDGAASYDDKGEAICSLPIFNYF